MKLQEEYALLQSIQKDPKAFGILFDAYYEPIFGYAFRRVADYDIAKDLTAETFLKAFLKINTFKWMGFGFQPWLYRIATNEVNQYFRKKKYSPVLFVNVIDEEFNQIIRSTTLEDERSALNRELKENEEFERIQQQLTKLDIKYQEVIALRYFEGKGNKSIAAILGKPEGTIKSLLSRGLEKLRHLTTT